ncbi:TetR/AcrR family transcriptional regulator [Lysobacter fragariae]
MSPSTAQLPARPTPRQDRSRRTEQALLDAALELFRERGVDAVTVSDIAAAAGVAPATIYRRFGDKDGLLKEAFASFTGMAMQVLDMVPLRAEQDAVELLADITTVVMHFSHGNQRLLQSSYAKALVDEFYEAQMIALRRHTIATLKRHFQSKAGEIAHPHADIAIDFALRQAVAMLSARLVTGKLETGSDEMSDAVFLRELMRSLLGYLQIPYTTDAIDRALSGRGL